MHSQEGLDAQEKEIHENAEIIDAVTENPPLGDLGNRITEEDYEKYRRRNGLDGVTYDQGGRHFPDFDGPYSEWKAERDEEKRRVLQEEQKKPAEEVPVSEPDKESQGPVEWKKAA